VTANRRLQPFRYLHDCSDCFRLERIAGWASHPLESAAFSRRTPKAAVDQTATQRRLRAGLEPANTTSACTGRQARDIKGKAPSWFVGVTHKAPNAYAVHVMFASASESSSIALIDGRAALGFGISALDEIVRVEKRAKLRIEA
jgi:hypothetical protein